MNIALEDGSSNRLRGVAVSVNGFTIEHVDGTRINPESGLDHARPETLF